MRPVHGLLNRGSDHLPEGPTFKPGKFGRLFPHLPPFRPPAQHLVDLGLAMRESAPGNPAGDNERVPAGYTYLGQFVEHDITFDTTPLAEAIVDPLATENFRSARLDLDAVYGLGPVAQPYLFTRASGGARLLIGRTRPSADTPGRPPLPAFDNDLPRSAAAGPARGAGGVEPHDPIAPVVASEAGFALIGDPRNDAHLIVAQLHLAFLKLHNAVVDRLAPDVPADLRFVEARRLVTWHYQWIVLHDFLPRLVDPATLADVLARGRRHYRFTGCAFIPVEFSAAAYRLELTMMREEYTYNRVFNGGAVRLARATLALLFRFGGLSGGDVPVPSNGIVDWRRFFDGLPRVPGPERHFNLGRKIDPLVVPALHDLGPADGDPGARSLPVRTLLRGASLGLPSGQAVARYLGEPLLSPADVASGPDGAVAAGHGLHRESPLWFYVLKEAQLAGAGERLGPVGSRILAEVFVGLLEADPTSFVAQDPNWRPTLPGATPGTFRMSDLLTLVGELNPLGD